MKHHYWRRFRMTIVNSSSSYLSKVQTQIPYADDGYTSLLTAVESEKADSISILKLLLENGADIEATGINGWTPLHMSACRGLEDKVKVLIDHGAQVNRRKDIDGHETPLMEAAFGGHPKVVTLLLEHGADPNLQDIMDETALDIARKMAKGADPVVVETLQDEDLKVDFDELYADTDMSPEELANLKAIMADYDPRASLH